MEHHSNIVPWHFHRERKGAAIRWVDVRDDGSFDIDAFAAALTDRTRMVAVTHMSNVLGTVTLLEAAIRHRVERFMCVSSDEVYGSIEEGSWDEDCVVNPNVPYAAAKAGSDLMALSFHRTHGLDVVVTRSTNNYGPYQFPEKVIPRFVTNLLRGEPVPLYGDGGNVRDWLHVADHCRGIHLVLEKGSPGEIYNIGGGTELTNRELTEKLLEATGRDWTAVEPVQDRKGHDRRYSVDISKIASELGYAPQVHK